MPIFEKKKGTAYSKSLPQETVKKHKENPKYKEGNNRSKSQCDRKTNNRENE